MAGRQLSYRFKFFKGERKTPLAQKQLRYATSFEVHYGKRKVLARTDFSYRYKKVQQRRDYLERLIYQIEKYRLEILEKRRKIAQAKREMLRKKKVQKVVRRRITRPAKKLSGDEEFRERYLEEIALAYAGLPRFDKVYAIEPTTALKAFVEDTLIIPIEPEDDNYVKDIIDKRMWRHEFGAYHLAIMDFNFVESQYIKMTADNFDEAYRQSVMTMLPHVIRYFESVKGSSEHYIFRVKFLNRWDEEGDFDDYGISYTRQEIRNLDQVRNLFRMTFTRLFGDVADPYTVKNKLRRNYLEGEKTIYIKGFTFEATKI